MYFRDKSARQVDDGVTQTMLIVVQRKWRKVEWLSINDD